MSFYITSNIHNSHSSHFKLGFRDYIPPPKPFPKPDRSQSEKNLSKQLKTSCVQLGTDKPAPVSLSKISFTEKPLKRPTSVYSKTSTNLHSFQLGFRPQAYPSPEIQGKAERCVVEKSLDKSSLIFGTDKRDLKTSNNCDYKPQTSGHTKAAKKNMTWDSSQFQSTAKLDYRTTSMDYSGSSANMRQALKQPDSEIFFPTSSTKVFSTTQNINFTKKTGKAVQDPSITKDFIYTQHFNLGNHFERTKPNTQSIYFPRDPKSALMNREKILGSEISLGLGKIQYDTSYASHYPFRHETPPRSIRNNQSFVKLGTDSACSKTEYSLEFKKFPFCQAAMPAPKNEKQNIKIC